MKKLRISLRYYRSMLPACLFVTAACAVTLWLQGAGVIPMLIFFKMLTLFLFFYFTSLLRPREFYYYYNLGVSKVRLWSAAAAVDLVVLGIVIVLTYSLFMK